MSANPVRLASRVLPGRKAALTSVITFFELDKASYWGLVGTCWNAFLRHQHL